MRQSWLLSILGFYLFLAGYAPVSVAQASWNVTYHYPLSGAKNVTLESGIGIRAHSPFDRRILPVAIVTGSHSGLHHLSIRLSADARTAILQPLEHFVTSDSVTVRFAGVLSNGDSALENFVFTTIPSKPNVQPAPIGSPNTWSAKLDDRVASAGDSDDVPAMHVLQDADPEAGRVLMANLGFAPIPNNCFLFVLDEHGRVLKRKYLPDSHALDFKMQPNGLLTYFDAAAMKFYGIDTNFNVVDSFEVVHGYSADAHELRIFPDGGYMLLANSQTAVDMSQHVEGGYPNASVTGSVIQIFDRDKNDIFEWRGIDHFNFLDAIHEDLTARFIDFEHANALDTDLDGNLILSNRHLSEVTKINRETGEILWRLGGAHNQFAFINDTLGFSYQHATRILRNGHLVLFDNGNFHAVRQSRALEYELDTNTMSATLVWQYHHVPEIYSSAMGYVERYANGMTLISWGANDTTMTEVQPDGSTSFEMSMDSGNFTYRAFKCPATSGGASIVSNPLNPRSDSIAQFSAILDPSGASILIHIDSPLQGSGSLALFGVTGREVLRRDLDTKSAGSSQVELPANGWRSGIYYCVLRTASGTLVKRILITR